MEEQLHKAIQAGDAHSVSKLLRSNASINSLYGMRGTPLCAAIYADMPDIVDLLLEQKCDINAKDFDGEPPLCLALRLEKTALAVKLLSYSSCDVNKIDPITDNRPIHIAVNNGMLDIVECLVKNGCHTNSTDRNGNTPLSLAIENGHRSIAKYLIDSNCSLESSNFEGDIPLHTCVNANNIDTLCDILDKISIPNSENDDTSRYIDYPAKSFQDTALIRSVRLENNEAAYELIRRGCDVNLQNIYGETALYIACKLNHQDMSCGLLEAGADPNSLSQQTGRYHLSTRTMCKSPLHEAINLGNLKVVQKLMKHGAELRKLDSSGNTPLCFALYRNKAQIAEYILDYVIQNKIPLFDAKRDKETYMNYPLIAVASCTNPAHFAKRLLSLGCDANFSERDGSELRTPLFNAVEFECSELAEVLLEHGAKTETLNPYMTALHVSASEGSLNMAALLIQWGADINALTTTKSTCLELALQNGNIEMAELLLLCGCKVAAECEDIQKFSPEMFCTDDDIENIARMVHQNAHNPVPLSFLCRNVILGIIRMRSQSSNKIPDLGLPSGISDFLRYKNLDTYKNYDDL